MAEYQLYTFVSQIGCHFIKSQFLVNNNNFLRQLIMKKLSVLVFVVSLLISFYACEKETEIENQPLVDRVSIDPIVDQDVEGKLFFKKICYYDIEPGRWTQNPFTGLFYCNSSSIGICSAKKICIPIIFDPCWFFPCWLDFIDPWDIYKKIDPREFLSFKDKLELDIDPREASIPFAINENIMGLQFYDKNNLMSFEDKTPIFTLENDAIFDAKTSKEIGLRGKKIKNMRVFAKSKTPSFLLEQVL